MKKFLFIAIMLISIIFQPIFADSVLNNFYYDLASDRESILITKYDGTDAQIIVPSEIEGLPVSEIATKVFKDNNNIESVVIPDTVRIINASCFSNCENLKSVAISKNIKEIPAYCFSKCTNLQDIDLPDGLEKIGKAAFSWCSSLKNISIPSTVTILEGNDDAVGIFSLSGITSVELPDSITEIPANIFHTCKSLSSVKIGKNVKKIRAKAFYGCSSLEQIELPETVQSIYTGAFDNCTSLTEIIIPESIKKIKFHSGHIDIFWRTNLSDQTKERLKEVGYKDSF